MFVPPSSETSKEILRTIAIEKETAEDVEIYNWKLIKGIFHLIQTKKISKLEFKQEARNFRLITRTNEVRWEEEDISFTLVYPEYWPVPETFISPRIISFPILGVSSFDKAGDREM
ncbi:hypothetical protein Q9966_011595 [Columba livia]|nr:hypothetical protein Q9966_011595 [Columba livia]